MVCEEPGWVVVALDGRLAQEGKGPSDHDVMGCLPFVLDSLVSFPGALRHRALQSLTREHPECAKAHPSFRPLIPSGVPLVLRMNGLPKSGYLSILVAVVGSDLVRPGFMFNQAPTMLFHIEHCSLFTLGVTRSRLKSGLVGPLPWTRSLV
ncbi:unnamed protein product [Sphagnum troendelagicum]|uniref:Uncharacterized protein n=1 Tax=Sphagnum troendelagicum TaxID=128251 RepID=A0ABP0USJ8_9BRYO